MLNYRTLGSSDLLLSPIGLGTWQFSGNKGIGSKFWNEISYEDTKKIVLFSLQQGINWLDTAEAYGNGYSEKIIHQILEELIHEQAISSKPYIADKWWPFLKNAHAIHRDNRIQQERLGNHTIELYQIHHPTSLSSIEKQMDQMKQLVYQGRIKHIGVSNFNAKQMKIAYNALKGTGCQLLSNQVRYNLIDRSIEKNGVLETAQDLGISIIAYSPLQQGILTGKFHDDPQKTKHMFFVKKIQYGFTDSKLNKTVPLIECLKELAKTYNGSVSQIALNWLLHIQGETILVIPGASKVAQVEENIGAMHFKLKKSEMDELTKLSKDLQK